MWVLWTYLIGIVVAWGLGVVYTASRPAPRDKEERLLDAMAVLGAGIIWPIAALALLLWTATDRLRERIKDAKENHGAE